METDPPLATLTTSLTTRFRQQLLAQRQPAHRESASQPDRPLQVAKSKEAPSRLGRDGDKTRHTAPGGPSGVGAGRAVARAGSGAQPRPLLPVTERRSRDENGGGLRRAKKGGQEDDRWDLTPDGGSAGREGRQFAVANVGNNGRIYLR